MSGKKKWKDEGVKITIYQRPKASQYVHILIYIRRYSYLGWNIISWFKTKYILCEMSFVDLIFLTFLLDQGSNVLKTR